MNNIDLAIGLLILTFAGIGLLRGALREGLSLFTWIVAPTGAWLFARDVAPLLSAWIGEGVLREILAFMALFLVLFLVLTVAGLFVRLFWPAGSPGPVSRFAGALLGAGRGTAIAVLLVMLAGLTSLPHEPAWRSSQFAPHIQSLALRLAGLLPPDVARQIRYG